MHLAWVLSSLLLGKPQVISVWLPIAADCHEWRYKLEFNYYIENRPRMEWILLTKTGTKPNRNIIFHLECSIIQHEYYDYYHVNSCTPLRMAFSQRVRKRDVKSYSVALENVPPTFCSFWIDCWILFTSHRPIFTARYLIMPQSAHILFVLGLRFLSLFRLATPPIAFE